jgi:dUTP pyrophosphatase
MRPTPSFPAELIAAALPSSQDEAATGSGAAADVIIERLHEDVDAPSRATSGSAGYDVRAYLKARTVKCSDGLTQTERAATEEDGRWGVTLAPAEMALIPLGFRTRFPAGIEAQVRPRSGQTFKHGLTIANAPGTVDADYAEEWMVIVRNDAKAAQRIVHGERIAQVVFARYAEVTLREGPVRRSTERAGGFGSTGKS